MKTKIVYYSPCGATARVAEAIAIVRKGKMIEVENPKYRVYVRLWRLTKPIRWPMFACWRAIKKLAGNR